MSELLAFDPGAAQQVVATEQLQRQVALDERVRAATEGYGMANYLLTASDPVRGLEILDDDGEVRRMMAERGFDRFQIVGKKDLYPNQLSGGQQQLVAVARAIIAEPSVILADEPTGSLHSSQGRMIMDLLKTLNDEGTTIIQVTHNEDYARYGNRIVQLRDGWIVDE